MEFIEYNYFKNKDNLDKDKAKNIFEPKKITFNLEEIDKKNMDINELKPEQEIELELEKKYKITLDYNNNKDKYKLDTSNITYKDGEETKKLEKLRETCN